MWCHVKNTTCTTPSHTTETTVVFGQSRAPPAVTTTLARSTPLASSHSVAKRPVILKKAVRHATSISSLTASASDTRRRTRRIMEPSSDPDFDDALHRRPCQELLGAFQQCCCMAIGVAKLDPNGSFARLHRMKLCQHSHGWAILQH